MPAHAGGALIVRLLAPVYELLWWCVEWAWSATIVLRRKPGGWQEIQERSGFLPARPAEATSSVWVHAVSVGEFLSIEPIILAIKRKEPTAWVVVTTSNERAYRMAVNRRTKADVIARTPWDSKRSVRRALARLRPDVLGIVECEIWPNLILETARVARVMMINARIYEKDFAGYRRARFIFEPVLNEVEKIATQSSADLVRFAQLGVDASRLEQGGNTKFDVVSSSLPALRDDLARMLSDVPKIVLASTHEGEEEAILQAAAAWSASYPKVQWIVAPRDPSRGVSVAAITRRLGFSVGRRSDGSGHASCDVLVLDTLGELASLFPHAATVFVGGSLVDRGGHNPIEPAVWGKPVFMGPFHQNFADVVAVMQQADGLGLVPSAAAFVNRAVEMIEHEDHARAMGERGRRAVEQQRGASDRYAALLLHGDARARRLRFSA